MRWPFMLRRTYDLMLAAQEQRFRDTREMLCREIDDARRVLGHQVAAGASAKMKHQPSHMGGERQVLILVETKIPERDFRNFPRQSVEVLCSELSKNMVAQLTKVYEEEVLKREKENTSAGRPAPSVPNSDSQTA